MTEALDDTSTAICVVIDCNEWIRLKWLGSPIGLTFISIMKNNPTFTIAIPEVLDGELDKHRTEDSKRLLRQLTNITEEINTVTGNRIAAGIVTLTEEAIEVMIRSRLSSIVDQIIYPKFDLDEVRTALRRLNDETPPNGPKNQQMKDSLLWEACVALSKKYRVFFTTGDKAFYADRDFRKGVAKNLLADPPVESGRLQIFASLESAIQAFAPESAVNPNEIIGARIEKVIAERAKEAFNRSPTSADLAAKPELRGVVPAYFRTDVPYVFAVSFTAFFYVKNEIDDRPAGQAAVAGECRLDTRRDLVEEVSIQTISWDIRGPDGHSIKMYEKLG